MSFSFWKPVALCCLLFPPCAVAQMRQSTIVSTAAGITPLVRRAAYIFSGTVLSVEQIAGAGSHPVTTMRITFHVDQAIRGVTVGQIFTIREWSGLWDAGERYRRGEQVLLFLYPPSRAGLTSPVEGAQGRFKVDRGGQVVMQQVRMQSLWQPSNFATPLPRSTRISTQDFARAVRRAETD